MVFFLTLLRRRATEFWEFPTQALCHARWILAHFVLGNSWDELRRSNQKLARQVQYNTSHTQLGHCNYYRLSSTLNVSANWWNTLVFQFVKGMLDSVEAIVFCITLYRLLFLQEIKLWKTKLNDKTKSWSYQRHVPCCNTLRTSRAYRVALACSRWRHLIHGASFYLNERLFSL